MADEKQVRILKQGAEVWNKWREEHRDIVIDLSGANLRETYLVHANLSGVHLDEANLWKANLKKGNLTKTYLWRAYLSESDLGGANLREAYLIRTNLSDAYLNRADFSKAILGGTIFGEIDFSKVLGLEKVQHSSSSSIDTHTLQRSKGKIPAAFLRGCGLSDFEIEAAKLYNPDLSNEKIDDILYKIHDLRAQQSVQVSPLFISYSHADATFVDRLEMGLNEKGVRFWRDIHDATAGRLEKQIEQAIRHNPTVLVILSKNSIQSDWVQHEVRKARALEKELKRDVLCPIALDGSWKTSSWPERIMEQVMEYNVLDFSKWEDNIVFQKMFVKLLDGLQLFYKG
jgi:uncharacterized protein YjbI with pentapeptide repeats